MCSSHALRLLSLALFVCCFNAVQAFDQHRVALRTPSSTSAVSSEGNGDTKEKLKNMSVAQLRNYLAQRSAKCEGCTERNHLIERAMEVRGWVTHSARVAMELTPLQQSADSHMTIHHIALADPKLNLEVVSPGSRQPLKQLPQDPNIVCEQMANNGTEYCHSLETLHQHASM